MLKGFFRIALRCLWRRKTYSLLNFICLAFGLTCAIITMLFIRNVFTYDRFHKNYERLYTCEAYVTYFNGDRFPKEYLSASIGDILKEQAPEIEQLVRITERDYSFINGDKTFNETGIYADDNFFNVFSFPLAATGGVNILSDPGSIVISKRMAVKFFGNTDCIGKTIVLKEGSNKNAYKISGVFTDIPRQSLLQFDFVIPFSRFLSDNSWSLETGASASAVWILLKQNADKQVVESKIMNLIKNQETTLNQELFLFPLKEQILYSYAGGKRVWKEMQNIVIIGSVGFAILLIACFNFINLAIAINFRRYREAGMRKVAGSGKTTIIMQFLGETLILTLISLITAVILVWILLAGSNRIFNYDIHLKLMSFPVITFFILITIFTSVISGIFPSLYLASANPVDTLKGKRITGNSFSLFRQSLIIFQFAIPIVLIICMMVIKSQDTYMRNYDVGVDKDNIIVLTSTINIQSHAASVKNDLLVIPGIDAVSFTNCIPSRGARVSSEVSWEGKDATEKLHFWCVNSDFDYNKTVRLNLTEGRFFDPSYSTDTAAFLINDVAAGVMKNKNPVGSQITVDGRKGTIIGVFKDFHAIDLAGPIVPTIISAGSGDRPDIIIRFSSGSFRTISDEIMKVYGHYETEVPFNAVLFGDLAPYSDLTLPSRLVGLAFIIALSLACLGLFGLASFTSETRTREIGIRKANGATTFSVMRLLLKNYTRWLVISMFIALPVAFMLTKIFLGRFYFHTPVPLWAFVAGPAIAFITAILTVSTQTWSIANRNPVKALRYE